MDKIDEVKVGGKAIITKELELEIRYLACLLLF